MKKPDTTRASAWIYRGLWGVLTRWFRTPRDAPSLPAAPGEPVEAFRPDEGYLRYLKFWFWLLLLPLDLPVIIAWSVVTAVRPTLGAALLLPALAVALLPDVVAYVLIHLRYDTTWYVMSDRSLRIRRGVVTISEMTITFENVQNVKVEQGPVERRFGVGRVVVDTAGVAAAAGPKGHGSGGANQAVLVGVADLDAMKNRVLQRVRKSRSAGLGDERHSPSVEARAGGAWSPAALAALRDVRDEARALRASAGS